MKLCESIALCYLITQVGAFVFPLHENVHDRNPLLLGTAYESESKKPAKTNEHVLDRKKAERKALEELESLAKFKDPKVRDAFLIQLLVEKDRQNFEIKTERDQALKEIGSLNTEKDVIVAELSVYKARSAIEAFEEKYGLTKAKELKKQAYELLPGTVTTTTKAEQTSTFKIPQNPLIEIRESHFEEQKYIRQLRWCWILKYKVKEFEVKDLVKAIETNGMSTEDFSEYIAQAYYYLSRSIHNSLYSKSASLSMTDALAGNLKASTAVSIFLSCHDFRKPFRKN